MLNQLLQRVWNRSDPANALTLLAQQRDVRVDPVLDQHVLTLIQRMMGADTRIDTVFSVRQALSEVAFNAYIRKQPNRKTLALWHKGDETMSVRQTDKQTPGQRQPFGHGIHFTDQLGQSADAVSTNSTKGFGWPGGRQPVAYRAIYEVHVGNQLQLTQHKPQSTRSNLLNTLDEGYDSVFVRQMNSLPGNEFIVYNPAQCTLRYLVKTTV